MNNERAVIRLLLADDSDETRASVRKLLSLEDDIEVVGEARNGREAVEKVKLLHPHVVLMDVRMPEVDGFAATETIVADAPSVQVIMMSVAGTADLLRRAMLIGAREFLVKPFEPDELVACIRRVHELHYVPFEPAEPESPVQGASPAEKDHDGRVIAIFSPKGGVGCTTVACNLAVALARGGKKRVALVDGCLRFGDVAMTLGLRHERGIADLAGMEPSEIDGDVVQGALVAHNSGLRAMLPPLTPDAAAEVSPQTWRRVLSELRKAYDCVVVDVSSSLAETDLESLDEADRIVTLFTLELTALKNVKLFQDLAKSRDYPKDKIVMVASRLDETGGVHLADAESNLHFQTALCIRNDGKLATLALNKGTPFVLTHANSSLAQSVEELAKLVAAESEGEAPEDNKASSAKKKGRFGLLPSGKRGKEAAA